MTKAELCEMCTEYSVNQKCENREKSKINKNFVIGRKGTGMVRAYIKPINRIQIGDIVEIKAQVVDYNDGNKKMKLRITGYAEDKVTPVDRYIWVNLF